MKTLKLSALLALLAIGAAAQCNITLTPDPRVWQGTYSGATTYALCDTVFYANVAYTSIQGSNTAHQPDVSPSWWSVTYSAPVNLQSGDALKGSFVAWNYNLAWLRANGSGGLLSAVPPISYNSGTGVFSMAQATGSIPGYLSAADWATFNAKQSTMNASLVVGLFGACSGIQYLGADGQCHNPVAGGGGSTNGTLGQGLTADGAGGFSTPYNIATVAKTGQYSDLLGKPTIPAAQVNSDWNSGSGVSQILNKPGLVVDTTVTFASNPAFAVSSGVRQVFRLTLTGDPGTPTINYASAIKGEQIVFLITEGGSGGYPFPWMSSVKGASTISTLVGDINIFVCSYDGTANCLAEGQLTTIPGTPSGSLIILTGASGGPTSLITSTVGSGVWTLPGISGSDTVVGKQTVDVLLNKTIDTAGPNVIKINGTSVTATTGSGGKVVLDTNPLLDTPLIKPYTFSTLPTPSGPALAEISDGLTSTCAAGGGTNKCLMFYNGSTWAAAGVGGSGTVTNTGTLTSGSSLIGNSSTDIKIDPNQTGTGGSVQKVSPTLTTPVIADFSTSQHTHANAANGGQLDNTAVKTANKQGTTGTKFLMASGAFTSGNCVQSDSSGNAADAGIPCSGVGSAAQYTTTVNFVAGTPLTITHSLNQDPVGYACEDTTTKAQVAVSATFATVNTMTLTPAASQQAKCVFGTLSGATLPGTVVQTIQPNTYSSGLQDFSAVTMKIPNGSGMAPTADGAVGFDTATHLPKFGVNGTTKTPEFRENKDAASGYAGLDSNSLIQLTEVPLNVYYYLGVRLSGAKVIQVNSGHISSGSNTIGTVPSNKRWILQGFSVWNDSASNQTSQALYASVTISATSYLLSNSNVAALTANAHSVSGIGTNNFIAEAGDVVSVFVTANAVYNLYGTIIEFDATTPLKVARLAITSSGNNTLYTAPGSTAAILGGFGGSTSNVCSNLSGSTRTLNYNLVPSGGSVATTNQLSTFNQSSSSGTSVAAAIAATLTAGDFLSVNIDSTTSTFLCWTPPIVEVK